MSKVLLSTSWSPFDDMKTAPSRAPTAGAHRYLGGPNDCWRLLLFGAILREVDKPVTVCGEPSVRLAKSGRWETGLARLRPALDDVLGDTAFALACRWASAAAGRRMWPGTTLVAQKATDRPVSTETHVGFPDSDSGWESRNVLARWDSTPGQLIAEGEVPEGGRGWMLAGAQPLTIHVGDSRIATWSEVDRVADMASAWLDADWRVIDRAR